MSWLIYIIILAGFCWLIPHVPFFKQCGIKQQHLVYLFLVRAIAGLFAVYVSYHYGRFPDSLNFFNNSLVESHWIRTKPSYFISETFNNYGRGYGGLLITRSSFWNNLKSNLLIKPMAVLNFITLRSFYTNTLIFNILIFTGSVALYRVLLQKLSLSKKLLTAAIFLYPPGLLFTATIHREGMIWLLLAVFLFTIIRIQESGFSMKRISLLLFSFFLIFCFRNYFAFLMIPALTGWLLSEKHPKQTLVVYGSVAVLSVILLFGLKFIIPSADFPQFIANRATEFKTISEGSATFLPMNPLTPDFSGFAANFPSAFYHAFLLPGITSMANRMMIPFVLELLCLEIMLLIVIFRKRYKRISPFTVFLTFSCLSIILVIGYIVPNLGAIIRYRSIFLHLIFILLLSAMTSIHKTHKHI